MNKEAVKVFYKAYGYEPTEQEKATVKDMLALWAKLEKSASRNPAILRKGIVFGLGLAFSLMAENKQSRAMSTVTVRNDM
jgi:hypothetical protein